MWKSDAGLILRSQSQQSYRNSADFYVVSVKLLTLSVASVTLCWSTQKWPKPDVCFFEFIPSDLFFRYSVNSMYHVESDLFNSDLGHFYMWS